MADIDIRVDGHAGRITLTRPKALNALSYDMCLATEQALDKWRDDPAIKLVILDAEGPRAFCAGGDIAAMYEVGLTGEYETSRAFWFDEYRMNAKIAEYPKPIVSFLHGFVMGGGVGLGGHCSHRVVCESSQVAMPECGIGFVPDVGGTYRLAGAPGHLGEYLGLTGYRMGPGEAIVAGFADLYVPEAAWEVLKAQLCETGDILALGGASQPAPDSALPLDQIDQLFAPADLAGILAAHQADDSDFAAKTLKTLLRNSPLSMALTLKMVRQQRVDGPNIRDALAQEYRVAHRILEHGDFIEGVRAQIIDKDRNPSWKHASDGVSEADVLALLAPLGDREWSMS